MYGGLMVLEKLGEEIFPFVLKSHLPPFFLLHGYVQMCADVRCCAWVFADVRWRE